MMSDVGSSCVKEITQTMYGEDNGQEVSMIMNIISKIIRDVVWINAAGDKEKEQWCVW